MKKTEAKKPEPIEPERKKPRKRSILTGCLIIILLFVGLVVASVLLFNRFLEKKFDYNIFKNKDKIEDFVTPDSPKTVPDAKDVVDFTVVEESISNLNVGVKPDVTDEEIQKLNLYLADKYFSNSSVYNIAYLNMNNPTSGEVIAVYNYNEYTGTDNLTVLPKELRYPGGE